MRRAAILTTALALAMTACASRPSDTELTDAIVEASQAGNVPITDEQASCIADALLDSGLSDTSLSGLADDFSQPEVLETEVDDVEQAIATAALACTDGLG